jgi:hypothetical protein
MIWKQGHIEPWWDDSFKKLDYQYYPLKNTHDLVRWINEGYAHLTLNGGLYNMPRPMPDYANGFFTLFPWQDIGIGFYKMATCDALPMHTDNYTSYRRMFDVSAEQMYRAIVFLENWKSGHYFEIDGCPLMPWKAGDWVYWNDSVPHFAGNFGTQPRYTLQITGHT